MGSAGGGGGGEAEATGHHPEDGLASPGASPSRVVEAPPPFQLHGFRWSKDDPWTCPGPPPARGFPREAGRGHDEPPGAQRGAQTQQTQKPSFFPRCVGKPRIESTRTKQSTHVHMGADILGRPPAPMLELSPPPAGFSLRGNQKKPSSGATTSLFSQPSCVLGPRFEFAAPRPASSFLLPLLPPSPLLSVLVSIITITITITISIITFRSPPRELHRRPQWQGSHTAPRPFRHTPHTVRGL